MDGVAMASDWHQTVTDDLNWTAEPFRMTVGRSAKYRWLSGTKYCEHRGAGAGARTHIHTHTCSEHLAAG